MVSNNIKPHVLFVDDEQRVLNSMRVMFRRDYELHLTTRGSEALQIVEQHSIDVIVADHRMPEMTGVEVLSQVRARSPRTVRILLTGYADLDAIEGSINTGEVFRFLTKPCPAEELRETIRLAAEIANEEALAEDAIVSAVDAATAPKETEVAIEPLREEEEEEEPLDLDATHPDPLEPPPKTTPAPSADSATGRPREKAAPPVLQPVKATDGKGLDEVSDYDMSEAPTIVLEGDSFKILENGEEEPPPRERHDTPDVGVVVFSVDKAFGKTIQQKLNGRFNVYRTPTIVGATKVLLAVQPGVLITDISEDPTTIERVVGTLKQHLPELVTIVISEHRDMVELVNLINYGQIFRFLRKPVTDEQLTEAVTAAVKKHMLLRSFPELAKRHAVKVHYRAEEPELPESHWLAEKLRSVRKVWADSLSKLRVAAPK